MVGTRQTLRTVGATRVLTLNRLLGRSFRLADCMAGALRDLYIDDRTWQTRHVVTDAFGGQASPARLVNPARVGIHWEGVEPHPFIAMLQSEAEELPVASSARPVCKQYAMRGQDGGSPSRLVGTQNNDPHLRSCLAMRGYAVQTSGGLIGQVNDFIIDPISFLVESIVIDTETSGAHHLITLPTAMISAVSFATQTIRLQAVMPSTPESMPALLCRAA